MGIIFTEVTTVAVLSRPKMSSGAVENVRCGRGCVFQADVHLCME